ncbi:hypothetical protein RND71_043416 [Anisodus tanguticus]|uniref:FHA domain-containing protein n=1 Tax=Anisodus tanguticus TaxID=243964 RepID=A0AAE1QNR2_9SOLA|nr:hypothetical protein RND71_043416 [Anisodus tanguticus]
MSTEGTPVSQYKQQQNILDDSSSQRRSSSRSIKRKKFDDELVESSIILPKGQRGKNVTGQILPLTNNLNNPNNKEFLPTSTSKILGSPSDKNFQNINSSLPQNVNIVESSPLPSSTINRPIAESTVQKKPKPITTTTKRRRYRNAHNNAVKDLGRWKPQDDLALVVGVQQLNDLESVYRAVKFSCKFTLKEIENRWFGLLYDPTIAKIGVAAMRQLHPDIVSQLHANAPYNEEEENLLKNIPSNSHPHSEIFNDLLQNNISIFLPFRTPKELKTHWLLMKHFHLLNDQSVKSIYKNEDVLSFSDAEEQIENELQSIINTNVPQSPVNISYKHEDLISQELALNNRKTKREIRQLENEIPKWQVLVDSITGVAPSDFDNETLAVLRGRLVRYLMRSREITLGRCTKDSIVDVDLSLEGPSSKISRKQALIKLNSNGDFLITNTVSKDGISENDEVMEESFLELDDDKLEELTSFVSFFLDSLKHKNMEVRYSASKGLGRITERLTKDFAEDVFENILDLFSQYEEESTLHGACLSIAELARRGLILPDKLPDLIPLISKALIYEELKGNFTTGKIVRDAACYICWAFARAFDPNIIRPFVDSLATTLIIVAVYDKEVMIRRAAAAAFQENVGRQGTFPNGIDIVTTVNKIVQRQKQEYLHNKVVYVLSLDEDLNVLLLNILTLVSFLGQVKNDLLDYV